MKIGYMNSPFLPLENEFNFASKNGFDYIELTIEPKYAAVDDINIEKLKRLSRKYKLPIPIGHSAWYVPYASPIPEVRDVAMEYMEKCLIVFNAVGAKAVNIHTNFFYSKKLERYVLEYHVAFLRNLVELGKEYNVKIMIELLGTSHETFENVCYIFDNVKGLYLHLDTGHFNLFSEDLRNKILGKYSKRILHMHVSDNDGREDQHMPVGAGVSDLKSIFALLKKISYKGRITLEIFSKDRDYLILSKDKVKKLWRQAKK